MSRQIGKGRIKMYNRHEMMELVIVEPEKQEGLLQETLVTGEIERHSAHAVVVASGGYGNVYFLSTNAMGSNVSAAWKIHKKVLTSQTLATFRFTLLCIPVHGTQQSKLTLMSESLRNSGRIWVPKRLKIPLLSSEGKKKSKRYC